MDMKPITFIDTEVEPRSGRVLDIGGIKQDGSSFHSTSRSGFQRFLKGSQYICGHNIFAHDLKYIQGDIAAAGIREPRVIDTLFLSPLLFPSKPYHALVKDDILQVDEFNNPLNDSVKARDLFFDEVTAFLRTDEDLKQIYYGLLRNSIEFRSFFKYVEYSVGIMSLESLIRHRFRGHICEQADLFGMISRHPVEMAYCLALIDGGTRDSITPPWVLHNFPDVERIMFQLRNQPCEEGCLYCKAVFDIHAGLQRFFGYDSYRVYDGEPLQEKAVNAAIRNRSLLAVFPTGGGKSITFQVPALMSGENCAGLTVVISPLQSLMKDQVDNLEKLGITDAVTVNGLLDPIERAKSLERVADGSASILYISPESLRSKTIESMLLGRKVVRFVIDEAHCFSSWGQEFRVDYQYIGKFIRTLQKTKNMVEPIPVSCFTATAKPQVIEDICDYFADELGLQLEVFASNAARTNLQYKVFQCEREGVKYDKVRDLLREKDCPTIIYVSRTKKAYDLAERLTADGFDAKPYHGRMDIKEKTQNQEAFINGHVKIMVATSAFGMGVDKKDVGMVIHYDISDSLENYVQEAGRAGRDENMSADCFVLFSDNDLGKHFVLLNQSKISIHEIQQIWKAIKYITRFRSTVSESALEIARKAGWDDHVMAIETRVKTAIAALETAGYLNRTYNVPKVYADGILVKSTRDAVERINASSLFNEKQKEKAIRIMMKLIGSRSRHLINEEAPEARVDYISDHLGIPIEEVIQIITLLRTEKILVDSKDLTASIKRKGNANHSLRILKSFAQMENYLAQVLANCQDVYHVKKLNEGAEEYGCRDANPERLKKLLNIWEIKHWINKRNVGPDRVAVQYSYEHKNIVEQIAERNELAQLIIEFLFEKTIGTPDDSEEVLVEFSVLELQEQLADRLALFGRMVGPKEIEDALFYLSKIGALTLEGGFLVTHQRLTIERLEMNNRKKYKKEDYQKLEHFYENKTQQIHIVGEYARKMLESYKAALQFVDDYFRLDYETFLYKYFNAQQQQELKRNMTSDKFEELFGQLSPAQLEIINDRESKYIVVAAGPGSGKTRILVHKLASLLLMEDVKYEKLLMVTFSRSAVTEFKKRLLRLIGPAAHFVEIKTFHSYCFDLLGRVGTLEKSGEIIKEATARINNGEVEASRITKTVLVIDEAQDMDGDEFALVEALINKNEDMRIIAVGDDDQNIFEFRGSSSKYLQMMLAKPDAVKYELVDNYRSKSNLVDFANQFILRLPHRLKDTPIVAHEGSNGFIKLVRYKSSNLVTPLVNDIIATDLEGSTCVLTKTNEEALQITGLLVEMGRKARLIQANDGFNLYNLEEIRFFLEKLELDKGVYTIDDGRWAKAKRELKNRFRTSPNFEVAANIVRDFEITSPMTKYKSDLEIFISESSLEDFAGVHRETIFVSTIHKSKGREFDNVYLMLDQFRCGTDEAKRQLYVGMTRAKSSLIIHYNGNYLDSIHTEQLLTLDDPNQYTLPDHLVLSLSYRDVWLDFFNYHQTAVSRLNSGDEISFDGEFCRNTKGEPLLKVSKQGARQVESLLHRGYQPRGAKIRFIVYWQKEDSEHEIKIFLPELYFERKEMVNNSLKESFL